MTAVEGGGVRSQVTNLPPSSLLLRAYTYRPMDSASIWLVQVLAHMGYGHIDVPAWCHRRGASG